MSKVMIVHEFWQFLRIRKKFWLAPIMLFLLLLGALIVLTEGSALAPFIYTLFQLPKAPTNWQLQMKFRVRSTKFFATMAREAGRHASGTGRPWGAWLRSWKRYSIKWTRQRNPKLQVFRCLGCRLLGKLPEQFPQIPDRKTQLESTRVAFGIRRATL